LAQKPYTAADIEVLARTIYAEASGQPFAGQVAVGWVVRNRLARPDRFGKTIAEVCLKPKQFSCWNENSPNFRRSLSADVTNPNYAKALAAAALVLTDESPDPTGGSDHYFADYITKPEWAATMTLMVKIGAHSFYREGA